MGVIPTGAGRSAAGTLEARSFDRIIALPPKRFFARQRWQSIAANRAQRCRSAVKLCRRAAPPSTGQS